MGIIGKVLLNKYRIEALIGEGGFGKVYRATHIQLNALRALKVLQRSNAGVDSNIYDQYSQRFQLEAQIGSRLDHPNTIRVYDFEQVKDTLVLVMEYVPGGSLADLIEQANKFSKPVTIDEALRYTREAAEGLSALHKMDMVHRDIKPSNILLDKNGHAKIADFGVVQVIHGLTGRTFNQNVAHPGTPAYMSPEQCDITVYLTPASDIYSLGLVLFELLTGRIYKNLRPGTLLRSMRGDTPEWVVELVTKMLADNPRKRPWDGAELANIIQNSIMTTSQIPAIVQTATINIESSQILDQTGLDRKEEAQKLFQEADGMSLRFGQEDKIIRLCTQAIQLDPTYAQAYIYRGEIYGRKGNYTQSIQDMNKGIELDPTNDWGYIKRSNVYLNKGDLDAAISDINKAIELKPANGWAYASRGDVYMKKGDLDLAILDMTKAIELHPCADLYERRSGVYKEKGDLDQAILDLNNAIKLYPSGLPGYFRRSELYRQKGNFDLAIIDLNKVIELDPTFPSNYKLRSEVYRQKGDFDSAILDLDKAIKLDPKYGWAYALRGEVYRQMGELDLAMRDLNKAIELDPQIAFTYVSRGETYHNKGDFTKAIIDLNKAIELDSKYASAYAFRGNVYWKKHDLDSAINDLDKVIELDPKYAWAYATRGDIYRQKGNRNMAIHDLNKAIELDPKYAWAYTPPTDVESADVSSEVIRAQTHISTQPTSQISEIGVIDEVVSPADLNVPLKYGGTISLRAYNTTRPVYLCTISGIEIRARYIQADTDVARFALAKTIREGGYLVVLK